MLTAPKISVENHIGACGASRLAAVLWLRNFYHPVLWEWGVIVHNLLTGKGYSYYAVQGQPMPSAFMPPAHAIFMAGVFYLFGEATPLSFLFIELVNVCMGVLLVYACYRLVRIYWPEKVAILSAFIIAIYPPLIYAPTEVANINFYLVINVAVVYFLAAYLEKEQNILYLVWAGLLLGLLMLYRGEAIALVAILGVILFWKGRASIRRTALFIVCALLVIAPWVIRNYRIFHRFIPTTTAMPFVLWYGHNSQATGTQRTGWGYSAEVIRPLPPMQHELDQVPPGPDYEIRYHQVFLREALAFLRTHPREEVGLLAKKFFYYWTFDMHHPKAWNPAYWIPTMALGALFWVGVGLEWHELWTRYYLFTTYIIFSMTLALIFHVLPRYRMFVEPLMVPFAATGLVYLYTRFGAVRQPFASNAPEERAWR